MRFPWQKKIEKRAAYDHQLIEAFHNAALGETPNLSSTSHLQAIANLLARSLAGAQVTPENRRTAAITPSYLYSVGQSIALRGEHVALIEAPPLILRPVSDWSISGTQLEQAKWRYRLTFSVPDGVQKRSVFGNEVVHIRLPDSERPWQPGAPMGGLTASATAELESAIQTELEKAARGKLVHVPGYEDADPDDKDDPWTDFTTDIKNAKGATTLAPAPSGLTQGIGAASAPPQFGVLRLRPEVDEDLQALRDRLGQSIASTLSVLPGLLQGGEATGIREAQRVFHNLVLTPLGRLIETELAAALETGVSLDFTQLQLGNLREKAQVVKALTDSGIDLKEARALAGLSS